MPDIAATRPSSGQPIETAWGQEVHDVVEGIQAGVIQLAGIVSASTAQIAVVFPVAFAEVPTILVLCASQQVTAGWGGQSPTGFNASARRNDGSASATSQPIQWIAIGRLA